MLKVLLKVLLGVSAVSLTLAKQHDGDKSKKRVEEQSIEGDYKLAESYFYAYKPHDVKDSQNVLTGVSKKRKLVLKRTDAKSSLFEIYYPKNDSSGAVVFRLRFHIY